MGGDEQMEIGMQSHHAKQRSFPGGLTDSRTNSGGKLGGAAVNNSNDAESLDPNQRDKWAVPDE